MIEDTGGQVVWLKSILVFAEGLRLRLSVGISQLISQYFESHLKLGLTFNQFLPRASTQQTSTLAAVGLVTESVDEGQNTLFPSHLRQLPPELLLVQTVGQEGGELGATEG